MGMDELEDSPLLSSIPSHHANIPTLTALSSTAHVTPTASSQAMEQVRQHFRDLYSVCMHDMHRCACCVRSCVVSMM